MWVLFFFLVRKKCFLPSVSRRHIFKQGEKKRAILGTQEKLSVYF